MTPVTLVPMTELMVVVPVPAPMFVIVPVLLSEPVEKVIVPDPELLLMVRLFVPVTPPVKVVEMPLPVLPMVSVPTLALVANTILFAKERAVVPMSKVAVLLPVVFPKVMLPVPNAFADVVPVSVPALMVVPVVYVLLPVSMSAAVVLF